MRNMKVSLKLIVSFMIVLILAIAVGVMGVYGMSSLDAGAANLYSSNIVAISALAELREMFNKERCDLRSMLLAYDEPAKVQSLMGNFDAYEQTMAEAFAQYESTITNAAQETGYFTAKETYLGPFTQLKREMFALMNAGNFNAAYVALLNASNLIAPVENGLAEGTALNDAAAQQSNQANDALYHRLTVILIAMLVVAAGISIFLAFYISGLVCKPLAVMTAYLKKVSASGDMTLGRADTELIEKYSRVQDELGQCVNSCASFVMRQLEVSKALETLAKGDLTAELALLSEKDTMGASLQRLVQNLNQMFGEINVATSQVSVGSRQIADGAQMLAQGSTEQAAVVEQLSASIGNIADKTHQNAAIAGEAAKLSGEIKRSAEKGNRQMEQMVLAVKEISEASDSIGKVIKVIDDIAFQTNILALNAAVEAARAGQHGKGFAVVAEEVRHLAGKSAEAAKNTGSLIENSREKATLGMTIATETAASLNEIVTGINRSAEIVAQIAQFSEMQAAAIMQVDTGIEQVAQVVQQNSATAEQSAAASEEMSGQSGALEQLISQFKLKDAAFGRMLPPLTAPPVPEPLPVAYTRHHSDFGKY